ncbi:MAG: Calx-beta domain-containing protein [Verrucomicrobiota bacterium]
MKTPRLLIIGLLSLACAATAQLKSVNDGLSNTLLLTEREGSYGNQGGSKCTAEFGELPVAGQPAKHTVWYRYVAPATGRFIVEIPDNQGLRAELRFPGFPATTMPLQTFVDGTSNTVSFDEERLSVDLERMQEVYLVVDAAQPFNFSWRFVEVTNDYYRDAESITGSSDTIIRSDRGATRSSSEANLGLTNPGIWFEWTAPATGAYCMDLVGSRQWDGTTFGNFTLRVYHVVSGAPGDLIATAGGSSLDNSTLVNLNVTAGHVYYIACQGSLSAPNSQIWLSWYPQGNTAELVWSQFSYPTSETVGFAYPRLLKLRGQTSGSVRLIGVPLNNGLPEATGGSDYQLPAAPILLPFAERSAFAPIPILPDITTEPQETFGIGFTDVTGGVIAQDGLSNTILIGEERTFPYCGVAMREIRVREGQNAYVELRRFQASDSAIVVGWRVNGGTCRPGVDMQDLSGTAYLAPGQLSTTIAVPVYADSVFEGPESFTVSFSTSAELGIIPSDSNTTTVLVDDYNFFVPNPGSYCGIASFSGWAALVKFTVTGIGGGSGTVDYQGITYRFTGAFDASGRLVASFARNGRPSIGLLLTFAEGWATCTAALRDPEGTYGEGMVRRLVYDGKTRVAPQMGDYTLLFSGFGPESVPVPAVMTSKVLGDGSVRFVGRTADEQTVTYSGRIGQADPDGYLAGECAFVLPLYNKTGNLWGHCDFGLGPQQPGAGTTFYWLKPWRPKDALYPAMPFQYMDCRAVRHTPPATGQRITAPIQASLGDGSVRFINGGTALDGTSNTLLISATNKVTFPGGNPQGCAITIDPKTGWFSGKIKPPGSTKLTNFYGVFLQGQYGYGRGYFPGISRSGIVEIKAVN